MEGNLNSCNRQSLDYFSSILHIFPSGSLLFKISATDSDDSRVTFSTDPSDTVTNGLVTLVQTGKLTAEVRLKKKLDREVSILS
jgi:hypothetical protein